MDRDSEYLDDPALPVDALARTLREQAWVNRRLGGGAATWGHALPWLRARSGVPTTLLEIGCGGADLTRRLVDAARRSGTPLHAVALDSSPGVLAYARQWCRAYPEITLVRGNAWALPFPPAAFDLVLLPTVLHHLPPDAVPAALAEAWRCCRGLLIVADVCRCPVAAWAFPLLGCLVGFGAVTRHDGRASLRRALTPAALARAAAQAGLPAPQVVRHAGCRMTLLARVGP